MKSDLTVAFSIPCLPPFGHRWGDRWWKRSAMVTVWHQDPKGDRGWPCGPKARRWKWHVHHWKLQIHLWEDVRAWIFNRCATCGRRYPFGYSPISFQWDVKPHPWWAFWRGRNHAHHRECADLVSTKRDLSIDRKIISSLLAEVRLLKDESEIDCLKRIYGADHRMEFAERYRLVRLMGYEFDDETNEMKKRLQ